MRPRNGRLWRSVAALCLPTAVVAAFGVYFLVVDVPVIVRDEKARVRAETERAAKAVRENPALSDFVWERGRGVVRGAAEFGDYPADMSWKDWKPESGTKRRDMWGWRPSPGGRLVWSRGIGEDDGDKVYVRRTNIEERDYALTFYAFVPLFLVVLVAITFLGVKFFVDYVRSRDDFLAATAHDLSTPLVGMRGAIGRSDSDAKVLVERMLRLVDNLKSFLRLGGRRPAPAKEVFDVVEAVREAYALFAADYAEEASGEVEFAGEKVVLVEADRTAVVQIAWNLLGNDLKYAAPFGKVAVRFSRGGGMARVEFADEGQGMSKREMRRAFDRYYRAKTVLESGKGGFGIGLCNARESAAAMGGSLSVRANVPHGCVFTLLLPLAEGLEEGAA